MDKIQKDIISILEKAPERLHLSHGTHYIEKERGRIRGCAAGVVAITKGVKQEPIQTPIGAYLLTEIYPKLAFNRAEKLAKDISTTNGHACSDVVPLKVIAKKLKKLWR